jgi:Tfp pilus assembly protein PilV
MKPRPAPPRSRPSPLQNGFAMIEVLVAAFVLTVGILGLIGAFDSARKLTLLSERRTTMAHRAQLEIERLQSYPYLQLAMISAPSHSGESANPDFYVNYSSPVKCTSVGDGCYAWNAEKAGEEEALVPAVKERECASTSETECGIVSATPNGRRCSEHTGACEWSDGLVDGKVYDFVTWHSDGHCGAKCAATQNYKRLTVVVTVTVPPGTHEVSPIRVSTLIAEPHP